MGTISDMRDTNVPERCYGLDSIFKLSSKVVPEFLELLERRYNILKTICYNEPVGRRTLSSLTNLGERVIRNEISFLKEVNLLDVKTSGMYITEEGMDVTDKLQEFIKEIKGISYMEEKLKEKFSLDDVIIVPGDCEKDSIVLNEMGRAAGNYMKKLIRDNTIIALTGGSSVKAFVDNFEMGSKLENILVLPARGGIGKNVELQSNTLAADLSKKIGCNYKLLYAPDNLSDVALNTMLKEKGIKETVGKIRNCDVLIYGIGRASEMAERRELSSVKTDALIDRKAVGEAFGIYFDKKGQIIYCTPTIGIKYDDLSSIPVLIAIAGGKSKSEAIIAVEKSGRSGVLVTDQSCAEEMVRILS